MKNKSLKDILFYITLIPYVAFVIMCIYYAVAGYDDFIRGSVYGIDAAWGFMVEIFANVMFIFLKPIEFCLFFLWIGYQIYYFITYMKNKKESIIGNQQSDKNNHEEIGVKQILYYVSILCWAIYFASGIFAFAFGSNTGGGLLDSTREYGIDALTHTLFWNLLTFSIIPILPISLLYIIIYLIVKKREGKK